MSALAGELAWSAGDGPEDDARGAQGDHRPDQEAEGACGSRPAQRLRSATLSVCGQYPPLGPSVKERCPLRGVLCTSLTDGSAAGVSSHEKNVFFSCVDEHMRKVKVDSRRAVNCFPFCGEYRGSLFGKSHQFLDQLTEVQGLNSRSNRSGGHRGIGFLMHQDQPLCAAADRALEREQLGCHVWPNCLACFDLNGP